MSRLTRIARVAWLACRGWSIAAVLVVIAEAAAATVAMVAIGQFVGALPTGERAWLWLGVTGVLLMGGPLLAVLRGWITAKTTAAMATYVLDLLAETSLQPRGIELLDSPGFSGRLQATVAATRDWTFLFGLNNIWGVLAQRLGGVGAFVVLLTWRWCAPFLVAGSFVLMSWTFTRWVNSAFDRVLEVSAAGRRKATYLRKLLTSPASAKEVRLFGLADWLLDRYRSTWLTTMAELWPLRKRGLRPAYLACLLTALVIGGVLYLLVSDVIAGAVGVAFAVTLIQAVLAVQAFGILGDSQRAVGQFAATVNGLLELRAEVGLPLAPSSAATVDRGPASIELDDVTFTYPTRDEPTLTGLSLSIPAGQSVAIVGVNGAGKSTLIKLLCGLYRPDRGSIRIGGADPADEIQHQPRVAAIFQDFVRYPLPLRDNVRMGASDNDQALLDDALGNAAGTGLLRRLDHGWDTVLSAEYDSGTDLSGGQWQRVALARALAAVSGGAGVLILDEPTAALDVRTEAALFDRFLEMTRGVTTILVTHRLSSVRHVERIVVLDPDRGIVEDGSYDALMAADGQFAELFRLQGSRFA